MSDEPQTANPSTDLINYRFDNQEKAIKELKVETKQNFDALNHKLDFMVNTFITRNEFNDVKDAKEKDHAELWLAINQIKTNMKWWATWVVTAAAAVAGVIYTLTHLHR